MSEIIDNKWKIKFDVITHDFYDLARSSLYTSKEVAEILAKKYTCIDKQKIEDTCRSYRQERYSNLEKWVQSLINQSNTSLYMTEDSGGIPVFASFEFPLGYISYFHTNLQKSGNYLDTDGSFINKADYPELTAKFEGNWNYEETFDQFQLPLIENRSWDMPYIPHLSHPYHLIKVK